MLFVISMENTQNKILKELLNHCPEICKNLDICPFLDYVHDFWNIGPQPARLCYSIEHGLLYFTLYDEYPFMMVLVFQVSDDGTLILDEEIHGRSRHKHQVKIAQGIPCFEILQSVIDSYKIKCESKCKIGLDELNILVKSNTPAEKYGKIRLKKIANEIMNLGYADDYYVCIDHGESYYGQILYYLTFCNKKWDLDFQIDFDNEENVKIHREMCHKFTPHTSANSDIDHDLNVGKLSVDIFSHILKLFKTKGKYANPNNPNIVELYQSFNRVNVKSARTAL